MEVDYVKKENLKIHLSLKKLGFNNFEFIDNYGNYPFKKDDTHEYDKFGFIHNGITYHCLSLNFFKNQYHGRLENNEVLDVFKCLKRLSDKTNFFEKVVHDNNFIILKKNNNFKQCNINELKNNKFKMFLLNFHYFHLNYKHNYHTVDQKKWTIFYKLIKRHQYKKVKKLKCFEYIDKKFNHLGEDKYYSFLYNPNHFLYDGINYKVDLYSTHMTYHDYFDSNCIGIIDNTSKVNDLIEFIEKYKDKVNFYINNKIKKNKKYILYIDKEIYHETITNDT